MKRFVRVALVGAGAVVLLFAAVAVAAFVVFDPNEHKEYIENLALEATGKKLSLQGDLSLAVFPGISIEAGPAELADEASFGPEPFLRVERVSASVAILPLFSGKLDVGAVSVAGARLKLAVNKAGKSNWLMEGKPFPGAPEDPTRSAASRGADGSGDSRPALARIALESLAVTDTAVAYTDMRSQKQVRLAIPELFLGPVAIGQKTSLDLKARYTGATAHPIQLSLAAAFTLPASLAETTNITADGKLDDTTFTFTGNASLPRDASGQKITVRGDLTLGDANLDRYAAPSGSSGKPAAAPPTTPASSAPRDASDAGDAALAELLRQLDLDVRIAVKSITAANIPVTAIKAALKADGGLLTVKPFSMTIADGELSGEGVVDAKGKTARVRIAGSWKGANAGKLLKAATGKERLTGVLGADWNLNASGLTVPALERTLGGKASFTLTDGALPAFQIIPKGVSGLPAKTLDIAIVRCAATWNVANGIARNDDLALKAVGLAASGSGLINIPARTINYKVAVETPGILNLPHLTVLPLAISGPLASPSYGVDQPELLRQTTRIILDPAGKAGGKLGGIGEDIGRGIGGALKNLKR